MVVETTPSPVSLGGYGSGAFAGVGPLSLSAVALAPPGPLGGPGYGGPGTTGNLGVCSLEGGGGPDMLDFASRSRPLAFGVGGRLPGPKGGGGWDGGGPPGPEGGGRALRVLDWPGGGGACVRVEIVGEKGSRGK